MMECFLKMAWGWWRVDPKIFLHHFENWDKHWNTGILVNMSLKNSESTCSAPWTTVMSGWVMETSFPAFCILLAPSNSTRSTTPKWSVFWLLGSFVCSICDVLCFKSPTIYLASFFPPFAISLVQSTISSNANGLLGLDPKKIIIGTLSIMAPLPNNAMPNNLDSFNRDLICLSYVDWWISSSNVPAIFSL